MDSLAIRPVFIAHTPQWKIAIHPTNKAEDGKWIGANYWEVTEKYNNRHIAVLGKHVINYINLGS